MENHINRIKVLSREDITDNLVIIKINRSYYEGMPADEIYDFTRGIWKRKLESVSIANFALSVVHNIVIEVYQIDKWIPASEAVFTTRICDPERCAKRVAFIGKVADEEIRNKYIGASVTDLFKYGEASPVKLFLKSIQ